jgi:hypothetical protein
MVEVNVIFPEVSQDVVESTGNIWELCQQRDSWGLINKRLVDAE